MSSTPANTDRLVGDNPDRAPIHAGKADDDVLLPARPGFRESVRIDDATDQLFDVIGRGWLSGTVIERARLLPIRRSFVAKTGGSSALFCGRYDKRSRIVKKRGLSSTAQVCDAPGSVMRGCVNRQLFFADFFVGDGFDDVPGQ